MENKFVKKYAVAGFLVSLVLAGAEISACDAKIDHTSSICLITKALNLFSGPRIVRNEAEPPTGVTLHQIPEMKKDLADKGVNDPSISYEQTYCTFTTMKSVAAIARVDEEGNVSYEVPKGYTEVLDKNGRAIKGIKEVTETMADGYGIHATYTINDENGEPHTESIVLRIK